MSELDMNNLPRMEEQSGGLREYLRLKLGLAAVIRSAMQLFH